MARSTNSQSENLNALAAELLHYHKTWQLDDNRPNPDEAYWDRVNMLINGFEAGEIPADCRRLAVTVEKLQQAAERFETRDDENNFYPRDDFWYAIEELEKTLAGKAPELALKPLEPIKELIDQKVERWQIAKMYGLFDASGEPQPHLVQKEIDNPGSVITKDWIDPRVKELRASQDAADRHAHELQETKTAASKRTPCPETPEELWQQEVPVEQSAKMLCRSEDEVRAMFEQFDANAKGDKTLDQPAPPAARKGTTGSSRPAPAKKSGARARARMQNSR